jgi:hypothetical protein
VDVWTHVFLTSGVVTDKRTASRPGGINPPPACLRQEVVSLMAGLRIAKKILDLAEARSLALWASSQQLVTVSTELSWLSASRVT